MLSNFSKCLPGLLAALAAALGCLPAVAAAPDEARLAFFEQRIRPVLVEQCYECHSAQSKKLKGGLRLDTRAGVLRGGETRAAIVPGDASRSLLIESVGYGNRDLQMPPKKRLPDSVVADLRKWVNDGAFDPREGDEGIKAASTTTNATTHWAFQPIRNIMPPPGAGSAALNAHPIDRFIAAKLAERGLSPAPPAPRRTLIRRAAYDLTGLPPTPGEIAASTDDSAPGAFERMIDRLLASPRYGERWGRWWLDLARYADSNGQDENKVMANAWRYRDWVIRSFNINQPFDAFITEQLAGDLLPTKGVSEQALFDRWTATGLLVMGPKMLAEQDKPKLVMDLVDEQIDVVSRAFLGLTVSCARCHDHKFDPVPTRDYYALAGIFKSTKTMANLEFVSKFNERRVTTAEQTAAAAAHGKNVVAKTREVDEAIRGANEALLSGWRTNLAASLTAAVTTHLSPGAGPLQTNQVTRLRRLLASNSPANSISRTLRRLNDEPGFRQTFLAQSENLPVTTNGLRLAPGKIGAAFLADGRNHLEVPSSANLEPAQLTVETWVRVSEFPKDKDERRWLVSKNPNEWAEGHYALVLERGQAGAYLNIGGGKENFFAVSSGKRAVKTNQWHHLAMTYDGAKLRLFVDGKSAGETEVNRPRVPGKGALVLGRRPDGYSNFTGLLDEARVYRRALTPAELMSHFTDAGPVADGEVVARWEFNNLSDADRAALEWSETRDALFGPGGVFALPKEPRPLYPAATRDAIVALEKARDALKAQAPPPVAFALAVEEDKPVNLPVHVRGSHLNPAKDPVPRGFIQAASKGEATPPPAGRSGRLELARWLTSTNQPLTARVIVNRIWQAHFGEGLVRTPDNFGLRGEASSHPELLDWLAREFIRSGWDVKQLHRLILTSATWQQAGTSRQSSPGGPGSQISEHALVMADHFARAAKADPENRLLWHFPRQRLEAEMIRDALLAVSGRLDVTTGGSLVSWKNDEYAPKDEVSAASVRRSVYLPVVRDRVFDVFTIFDFANPSVGTAKRTPTVVSHQALFFLNSPLVKDSARALAASLLTAFPTDQNARINHAYERAFGRLPLDTEKRRAAQFVAALPRGLEADTEVAAWAAWCQMLFAANEFVYRE